jgi:hypothetical protein
VQLVSIEAGWRCHIRVPAISPRGVLTEVPDVVPTVGEVDSIPSSSASTTRSIFPP